MSSSRQISFALEEILVILIVCLKVKPHNSRVSAYANSVSVQNPMGLPNSYPDSLRAISLGKGVIFLKPETKSVRYLKAETPSFLAVSMIDK